MTMKPLQCMMIILLLIFTISHALADRHVLWQRLPITIHLTVGHEKLVTFPSTVRFGYDRQLLPSNVLRVNNDDHTIYLLAKHPFSTKRVEAKLANGSVVLLNLQATRHPSDTVVDIQLPVSTHSVSARTSPLSIVTLTRYAIQQLYAPQPYISSSSLISRFPMDTTHVVPLFLDGSATAMPLASWQGGNHYVTAVLVKNALRESLTIQPQGLCGQWTAESAYPRTRLDSLGSDGEQDSTTLFLVSSQPFARALQPCLSD